MKVTTKLRRLLLAQPNTLAVRITRDGWVHAKVTSPRGDGGKSPWWQCKGTLSECARDLGLS